MSKNFFCSDVVIRTSSGFTNLDSLNEDSILRFFLQVENKERLLLASPVLYYELIKFEEDGNLTKAEKRKIYLSLLKYYLRINQRCTPFGLFAGCSIGNWSDKSLAIKSDQAKRSTRLDMHYSVGLGNYFAGLDSIKPYLNYFPNTSLYHSFDKLRYTEFFYRTKSRKHQLTEIDSSPYLLKLLSAAKSGLSIKNLVNVIIDEDISDEMAESFVHELISNQVLVSELDASVTGDEFLKVLQGRLERIYNQNQTDELKGTIDVYNELQIRLKQLDQNQVNDVKSYNEIIDLLKVFPLEIDESKIFQVDLFPTFKGQQNTEQFTLDQKQQKPLLKVIPVLSKLVEQIDNHNLSSFKKEFYTKYEDRSISLLELMDNEIGIGYGKNLKSASERDSIAEDIYPMAKNRNDSINWSPLQSYKFQKLVKASIDNSYEVEFNLRELEGLPENEQKFPDSWCAMYSVIKQIDNDFQLYLKGFWGPSATTLLGRFASGNEEIKKVVKDIANSEAQLNKGKILAEIAHLPENRVGNILHRPTIRNYEITYLAGRNEQCENQIPLDDLYIRIVNEKIILWSKQHNMEVLPRMANAHNYNGNPLPLYQLLCDLQTQDTLSGLSFSWGNMQNQFTFLPRVKIYDVIVFPATWQFRKEDFSEIINSGGEKRIELLFKWKEKWKLPDRFYIAEGDNELFIHLVPEQELLIELFFEEIKNKAHITLKEFLFDLENPLVIDENGFGYTNEIVAPILLKAKTEEPKINFTTPSTNRTFIPGSEWLYFKIYSGTKTSERILQEIISPLIEDLKKEGLIDQWFFIRYGDPDPHLRVRFHSDDLNNISSITKMFYLHCKNSFFGESSLKIQIDTYNRELERYGDENIILTEKLFFIDSECTLKFIHLESHFRINNQRWKFAILALNEFLNDFNFSEDDKIDLLDKLSKNFKSEFNLFGKNKIQIDKKYRKLENEIDKIFDKSNTEESLEEMRQILRTRSKTLEPTIAQILKTFENNKSELKLKDYVGSCVHMMMNRIFANSQRLSETLVYDFLFRYLKSRKIRSRKLNADFENSIIKSEL